MTLPAINLGAGSSVASRRRLSISLSLIFRPVSSVALGIGLEVELGIESELDFSDLASEGDEGDWLDLSAEVNETKRSRI